MEATGRKLDSLVAKVMGVTYACQCEKPCRCHPRLPEFSKDIGRAMEVFNRMRQLGHRWLINSDEVGLHLRHVAFVRRDLVKDEKGYIADRPLGTGATLEEFAEVICAAAVSETEGSHHSGKK